MIRFLKAKSTPVGWCLSLLLTELVLCAQPAANRPAALPSAGEGAPLQLSLGQAQTTAFQKNWDLLAAKAGIDAATAQLIVAKEFPDPTLSWSTMKIDPRGNGTPLGNSLWDRSYDTIASVNQLVEIV